MFMGFVSNCLGVILPAAHITNLFLELALCISLTMVTIEQVKVYYSSLVGQNSIRMINCR